MKQVIIIGGGIIGLSAALYLRRSGWQVTVLDKGDFEDNCSYGNAGYVCPSHFVPLASPGVVKQGLRWMWNSRSPFYVQPRLNRQLLDWGWQFIRSATREKMEKAAVPLRDIALLSQREYSRWVSELGHPFGYAHKGLLEIYQTQAGAEHASHMAAKAQELGLDAILLDAKELQEYEPQAKIQALGAVYFRCDAHLFPNRLMKALIGSLRDLGVEFRPGAEVKKFEISHGSIQRVITESATYESEEVVLAAGSWSGELASRLNLRIPLVPGRGYSVTLENSPHRINHPAILMEGRVALTPLGEGTIRFGGTMEITSLNRPPRYERVQGILNTVQKFFPEFREPMPPPGRIWFGYRPCSADGLPYIGRTDSIHNLVIATGHSMLGLSLGAGTGKLVGEIINHEPLSMDISPFRVERFSK